MSKFSRPDTPYDAVRKAALEDIKKAYPEMQVSGYKLEEILVAFYVRGWYAHKREL
jgi:hypothetical protein